MESSAKKAINIVHTNVTAESVSRHVILSWINNTLGSDVQKVEDLCSGSIYCLLMEHLFGPGTVQLKRVKFQAHLENEYIQNFKVLQVAFNNCGVDRAIPIERLVKGRYNDNYDFAQWFKMFYDANYVCRRPEIPKLPDYEGAKATHGLSGMSRSKVTKVNNWSEVNRRVTNTSTAKHSVQRPVSAAPAVPELAWRYATDPAYADLKKLASKGVHSQFRVVQRKLDELNLEMRVMSEDMGNVHSEKNISDMKLAAIEELCAAEDKKESSSPEMAALLHRIFRVLKRTQETSPGGFRIQDSSTPVHAQSDSEGSTVDFGVNFGPMKRDGRTFFDNENDEDAFDTTFGVDGENGPLKYNIQDLGSIKEEERPCYGVGDASCEPLSDGDF